MYAGGSSIGLASSMWAGSKCSLAFYVDDIFVLLTWEVHPFSELDRVQLYLLERVGPWVKPVSCPPHVPDQYKIATSGRSN